MTKSLQNAAAAIAICLGAVATLASCASEATTTPRVASANRADLQKAADAKVAICHQPSGSAKIIPIAQADLPAYLAAGDYVAGLEVGASTDGVGDGVHFARITDALDAARNSRASHNELATAHCRITINVAPGKYEGSFTADATRESFPLLLDAPSLTLQGGLRLQLDGQQRATAVAQDESQTSILVPAIGLTDGSQAIIVVTRGSGGSVGNDAVIDGFSFRSGHVAGEAAGGAGIFALGVTGLVVHNDRFESLIMSALDLRSSSATIENNYASQLGNNCGFCLAGPGTFTVDGNAISAGGQVGVFVASATKVTPVPPQVVQPTPPTPAAVTATITNNDVRGHVLSSAGFTGAGIRITPLASGAPAVDGWVHVDASGNTLANNAFGIIADAGFPPLGNTALHGTVDVTLHGNTMTRNCENNVLMSFQRHTKALGLTTGNGNAGILFNSAYTLQTNSDLTVADLWYDNPTGSGDNPSVDPGNSLLVDRTVRLTGTKQSYSTSCSSTYARLGLKNSDDVGTNFDLQVQVLKNDVLIDTGELDGLSGGSSGLNNAIARQVAAKVPSFTTGDKLTVQLSVRIATGMAGHASGWARLWYGSAAANSGMTVMVNGQRRDLYLTGNGLDAAPGATALFSDVLVSRNAGGNAFKSLGSWSITF